MAGGKELQTHDGGHKLTRRDLAFMQEAMKFNAQQMMLAQLPTGIDKAILYGVEVTKVGNDYTHTAGAIYYQGEIYGVDELINPLTDVNPPKFILTEEVNYEVEYASGVLQPVHLTRKLQLAPNSDPEGLFEYNGVARLEHLYHQKSSPSGTYKDIQMEASEISTHFNGDGDGISDWYIGWRIASEASGRVKVAYKSTDTDFNETNGSKTGGDKTHTLVESEIPVHGHSSGSLKVDGYTNSINLPMKSAASSAGPNVGGGNGGTPQQTPFYFNVPTKSVSGDTGNKGGGAPHNNMQPYIVVLTIVKV